MVFQSRLNASPVRWFLQLSYTFKKKLAVTSMSEVPVLSIGTISPLNFSKIRGTSISFVKSSYILFINFAFQENTKGARLPILPMDDISLISTYSLSVSVQPTGIYDNQGWEKSIVIDIQLRYSLLFVYRIHCSLYFFE